MKYPMIEIDDPFIGTIYREMTPPEYDEQIQWYRDYAKNHANDKARRTREYVSYLNRWFGSGFCDGLSDVNIRLKLHKLPMAYNIYFN